MAVRVRKAAPGFQKVQQDLSCVWTERQFSARAGLPTPPSPTGDTATSGAAVGVLTPGSGGWTHPSRSTSPSDSRLKYPDTAFRSLNLCRTPLARPESEDAGMSGGSDGLTLYMLFEFFNKLPFYVREFVSKTLLCVHFLRFLLGQHTASRDPPAPPSKARLCLFR